MKLDINEEALRRWFNLSPDTPIDFWTIAQHVESYPGRDRKYALGEFLTRQFLEQGRTK